MTTETFRDLVRLLEASSTALAAIGAAIEARIHGRAADPHVTDVLTALGASEVFDAEVQDLSAMLAETRTNAEANMRLLFPPAGTRDEWSRDPATMAAAGEVSASFAHRLRRTIAPSLPGLAERLAAADGAFLDVGVGVAALSISMARTWPNLRIVGVDPSAPALDLARRNVHDAGFDDRIELRHSGGEDLTDRAAFDLAWVPSLFVPERVLGSVLERVHDALRPGGYLLLPVFKPNGHAFLDAATRLRVSLWGGSLATLDVVRDLLLRAGFDYIAMAPSAPASMTGMFVARKSRTM